MQFIELRTLVRDSAKASALPGTGDWRTTSSGVPALCATDAIWCTFERSGPMVNAAPILQAVRSGQLLSRQRAFEAWRLVTLAAWSREFGVTFD